MRRSWVAVLLLVGACMGPVRSSEVDAAKGSKAFGRYLTQVLVQAEEDAGSPARSTTWS